MNRSMKFFFFLLFLCSTTFAAVEFDGVDDFIHIGTDKFEDQNAGTIACWVKIQDYSAMRYIFGSSDATATASSMFVLWATNQKFLFQHYISLGAGDNNAAYGDTVTSLGQWYHVAWTCNGTVWAFYINAHEEALNFVAGSNKGRWFNDLPAGTHNVRIGRARRLNEDLGWMSGLVSDFAIWSVALDAEEVETLYNSRTKGMPLQIQPSNLLMYLPLDDQPDGTSFDGDTAQDRAGSYNSTGDDGGNNTGLTATAENFLNYP